MAAILQIRLLGEFSLVYSDQPVTTINTARLQSLLAYLVLHRDAPQPRYYLAFQFWPESTESQARTNLRKLFHQLHQALPEADRFLCADTHALQWRPDAPFTLDVAEFENAVDQAISSKALRNTVASTEGACCLVATTIGFCPNASGCNRRLWMLSSGWSPCWKTSESIEPPSATPNAYSNTIRCTKRPTAI